jgi:hypothetical protein
MLLYGAVKKLGRKMLWPDLDSVLAFARRNRGKGTAQTAVRVACLPPEIRTENILDRSV